jgi:hypothetical protein
MKRERKGRVFRFFFIFSLSANMYSRLTFLIFPASIAFLARAADGCWTRFHLLRNLSAFRYAILDKSDENIHCCACLQPTVTVNR